MANQDMTNRMAAQFKFKTWMLGMLCLTWCVGFTAVKADQESIDYPKDVGVFNVRDFGAKGDGVTDDTQALEKAIAAAGPNRMLYLPDGVYLVSRTLVTRKENGDWIVFLTIQGQSTTGTVIKLKDNSPAFQDPKKPQPIVQTREGNMAFRYRFSHFTLDTGQGNPGATGIAFISCNLGSLMHVHVRSGDAQGKGAVGIDCTGSNPGLSLVKHVKVTGFNVGIDFGNIYPGMAFEHVTLEGQHEVGFRAGGTNGAAIRGLISRNAVPALVIDNEAQVVLSDSDLQGQGKNAAIVNQGQLLIRNTNIQGYAQTLEGRAGQRSLPIGLVDEYASHPAVSLFPSTGRSLQLPVAETPGLPWDADNNFAQWVNVQKYGAKGDGKADDTQAIQAALDAASGQNKSTVYFPQGNYKISRTLTVSGSVRRLVGMPSTLVPNHRAKAWPWHGWFEGKTEPVILRVADGSPVVMVDRLAIEGTVEHAAANDLVFRLGQGVHYRNTVTGGRAFFEDYGARYEITGPQHVFVRLWNPTWGNADYPFFRHEPDDPAYARNDGGTFWVMGADHESNKNKHVLLRNLNGAKSEIIGLLDWQNKSVSRMFENRDARLSIAGLRTHTGVFPTDIREGWRRDEKLGKSLLIVADLPTDATAPAMVRNLQVQPTGEVWPFNMKLTWDVSSAEAAGNAGYEIQRDGKHLGFTDKAQFIDSSMQDDTEHQYQVLALNKALVRSEPAKVSGRTPTDTRLLSVEAVYATAQPARVHVMFSKPVEATSAVATEAYRLTGAVVRSAKLEADLRTVTLETDALDSEKRYELTVAGVRDRAGKPSTLAATPLNVAVLGLGDGLLAEYFADPQMMSQPVVQRIVSRLDHDWKDYAPVPELDAEQFALRFSGQIRANYSETYTFNVESVSGVRVWVDGQKIFDTWTEAQSFKDTYGPEAGWRSTEPVTLNAGKLHDIRVELRQWKGNARLTLRWESPSQAIEVVPSSALYQSPGTEVASIQHQAAARFDGLKAGTGVTGIYHRHPYQNQGKWERQDARIDFAFGDKVPPGMEGKLKDKWYRIEWHGWVRARQTGWHKIGVDLGPKNAASVFMDGYSVLQGKTWFGERRQIREGEQVYLQAGELVPLYMTYRQEDATSLIQLWWIEPDGKQSAIPTELLYTTPQATR